MADERNTNDFNDNEYREETAAEVAPLRSDLTYPENEHPRFAERDRRIDDDERHERTGGKATGMIAIILSVLSLFIIPVLFGAAGVIVGFIARRQGAHTLGNWAIGIGIASILISLFFAPFF
ncbi:hypothetical protein [Fictibacillus barbaricus]|uniref:DUF4190 domain-containing protein n=1 Tax=Fictibacillus barbaricus TaxID=182136 RepID=A0ABU1TZY4_9BACL|nr:hypothetical protein [Fictibacillus barbaricus]MDR7072762.1 hypothetical protein [Fictibacillus barbaricus]